MISDIRNQMVEIPGGKIDLRDDRIKQKWTVEIPPFLLSKKNPSAFIGNRLPVDTLTWREAILFCNSLSIKAGLAPCYFLDEIKNNTWQEKQI
jgi:hypothetical protein